jgi:uncharacterized membrane protein HdeD (DUF308 family)
VNAFSRRSVLVFGVLAIALGVAILARTAWDGGTAGYLFGVLFIGLGAGRLYLVKRR